MAITDTEAREMFKQLVKKPGFMRGIQAGCSERAALRFTLQAKVQAEAVFKRTGCPFIPNKPQTPPYMDLSIEQLRQLSRESFELNAAQLRRRAYQMLGSEDELKGDYYQEYLEGLFRQTASG